MAAPTRCAWCGADPLYQSYHDLEWGVPLHDETRLFEFLILEGAQAGLSWLTILKKREGYRRAFADFDAERVAAFGEADVTRLLADRGGNIVELTTHLAGGMYLGTAEVDFGARVDIDELAAAAAGVGRDLGVAVSVHREEPEVL